METCSPPSRSCTALPRRNSAARNCFTTIPNTNCSSPCAQSKNPTNDLPMLLREFFHLRKKLSDLKNRLTPGVLILLYHRIASLPSDPCRLNVSPKHFAEHLEALKKTTRVMSLRDLARALDEGTLPHRAVGITFDYVF